MHSAFQSAFLPTQPAAALVGAFAGVGSPSVRAQWHDWFLEQKHADAVEVVDDGEPLIAAGLPDGWGIVLICGTGSAAFGRSQFGESTRAGGWGYLFSDEGSGFAIGQAALRAMTQEYDRRAEPSPLMRALEEAWSIHTPREIVDRVYRAAEPRQQIADAARIVCAAAESGDAPARQILQSAADDLAKLVRTVAEQLELTHASIPLALSGGVATNSRYLQQEIAAALGRCQLHAGPITIVTEPAQGCIELARRLALR
jgi:N-acetylglucosamine kinase-like BadF-type ATPase